jgi:hypothetical protein
VVRRMAGLADKAKKFIEQAGGTPKKEGSGVKTGSGKRSASEKRGGGSLTDRAKRAAKEFLK